jgi:hypothetical protein
MDKQQNNSQITATKLFYEAKNKLGLDAIRYNVGIHNGTIQRWIKQQKVPESYYNDLNFLLDNKYQGKSQSRDIDQFYTNDKISKYCFAKTLTVLHKLDIDEKQYHFIEPSAGCCNFFNLLPKNRRVGVDIEPKNNSELVKNNYLNFYPTKGKKYIVIGNPPFGLRGNLALRFINHSYGFADVVAFILPPLFDSDGKGSPKKRVTGYKLAHSENLPLNSFEYPDGKPVDVATIFQVWVKINTDKIKTKITPTCKDYIKIYSLSDGGTPASTRNKKMLYKCDAYLPSTCYKGMRVYDEFEKLPHRRGYGIVFLQQKKELKNLFYYKINWQKTSFLSTNSAMNLRTSLIENAIIKFGYIDKNICAN